MRILIVGKNGQVGSALIVAAEKNKINFIATNRADLDITNKEAITRFFEKHAHFDFVINAAAYTHVDHAENNPENAHDVNCNAVGYLAKSCKKYNMTLIHISTDYIFNGEKESGYNENDETNPTNIYGKTKLAGEQILMQTWHKHIILRVSWIFSEYGRNFVKTISSLLDKQDSVSVVSDQFGSPTSAHSVASVIITICKKLYTTNQASALFGIYHYSDFPTTNWHQFAHHIAQLKQKNNSLKKEVYAIKSTAYPTPARRPKNSILTTTKIKSVFGIEQQAWMPEVERIISAKERGN